MHTHGEIKRIKKTLKRGETYFPMVFYALSDPSRLCIVRLLMRHRDICVSEVARILDVSVPAASQQLRILEMSGLVRKKRKGQMICYEIKTKDSVVKSLLKILSKKTQNTRE